MESNLREVPIDLLAVEYPNQRYQLAFYFQAKSIIANSDAEIIAFASELLEGWNLLRCLSFLDGLNDFVNTRR